MTVCIAAMCMDGDEHKIVLCTDRRLGGALGSSETALKNRYLATGWRCLTAGNEPDILALLRLYNKAFENPDNLTAATIDATIKSGLFQRKKELADEYIRNRFVMPHDDFLKFGKEKLPNDLFHDGLQKISSIDLKADLIVAGFIDGAQEIYVCRRNGKATPMMEFAVIGEGEYLAESVLLRRGQNDIVQLHQTLYNVYEAKRYAEAVGSVGKLTSIRVLSADGEHKLVSSKSRTQLRTLYNEYGPKTVTDNFKLEGPLYYEEPDEDSATGEGMPPP